jgi:autotransporter-associated beta strand protein
MKKANAATSSSTPTKFLPLLVALAALLCAPTARAANATYFWDTDGATAGFGTASGTWGTDTNWSTDSTGGTAPAVSLTDSTDRANFGSSTAGLAAGTVTVTGTQNISTMTFGAPSGDITLSGGTIALAAASAGVPNINVLNSGTNTISSVISGTALTVASSGITAPGKLLLTGSNTFTGALNIRVSGIVVITNAAALGAGTATRIGSGGQPGTLQLDGSGGDINVVGKSLQIRAAGAPGTTGALQNLSGNNTWGGAVFPDGSNTWRIAADSGSLTFTNSSFGGLFNGANLTLGGSGTIKILGAVTGTGTGQLNGIANNPLRVELYGAGTYTGGSTLAASNTWVAGNDAAFGTGQIRFAGATLQGDGTARTLANSWTISGANGVNPGSTIGGSSALTFTGSGVSSAVATMTINNSALTTFSSSMVINDVATTLNRSFTIAGSGNSTWGTIGQTGFTDVTALGSGTGAIRITNSGTTTFNGNSTYTGFTRINSGTLVLNGAISGTIQVELGASGGAAAPTLTLGASNLINSGAKMELNIGTLNTGGFSQTMGAFTLKGVGNIDLGSGSSILQFADSSAVAWTGSLTIKNWSGDVVNGGGTDQLFFGTTASGLTAGQLALVSFLDPAGFTAGTYAASILSTGELVPIPEPATMAMFVGGLGMLALYRRMRRRQL